MSSGSPLLNLFSLEHQIFSWIQVLLKAQVIFVYALKRKNVAD